MYYIYIIYINIIYIYIYIIYIYFSNNHVTSCCSLDQKVMFGSL